MGREILGRDVEGTRGEGFVDGDINTADPGAIHADMRHQVATAVGDGNVHRLTNFSGLLLGRGNHASGIVECDHETNGSLDGRWIASNASVTCRDLLVAG